MRDFLSSLDENSLQFVCLFNHELIVDQNEIVKHSPHISIQSFLFLKFRLTLLCVQSKFFFSFIFHECILLLSQLVLIALLASLLACDFTQLLKLQSTKFSILISCCCRVFDSKIEKKNFFYKKKR